MRASVTCLLALALVGATACGQQRNENKTNETAPQAQPAPAEQTQQQTQLSERAAEKNAAEKKEAGVNQPVQGQQVQNQDQQKAVDEKKGVTEEKGAKAKTAEDRADQIRKDADAKADKLKKDADAKCDQLKKNADNEGDRIKKAADAKADRLKGKTGPTSAAPAKEHGAKHATVGKGLKGKESKREKREGGRTGMTEPTGETTITGAEVPAGRPSTTTEQPMTPPQGALPPVSGQPAGAEPYVNHSTVFGDGKSGMYTDGQGTYGGRATWGTGTPRR